MHVAVIFGGRSAEHEISLLSGDFIARTLAQRHMVLPIYITRNGEWWFLPDALETDSIKTVHRSMPASAKPIIIWHKDGTGVLFEKETGTPLAQVDCAFPALHGPYGEDGTIQGMFEMLGIPYVGADVLGSAIGMDKATTKYLLKAHQLPTVPFIIIDRRSWEREKGSLLRTVSNTLQLPVFVKPSNLGSSVGIVRVTAWDELESAIHAAFDYDVTLLVEQGLTPIREVECSVLDGSPPRASVVGEITYARDFYDYKAKYEDDRTQLHIPADLPDDTAERVRELAVQAFLALRCSGMARVDFFVHPDGIYINEINTIPGFTPFSMYHRLWSASGLSPQDLLEALLQMAMERYRTRRALRLTPLP